MPDVRLYVGPGQSNNFYLSEIRFCKNVAHILFAIKGVPPKVLEPMLRGPDKTSLSIYSLLTFVHFVAIVIICRD